MLIDGIAASEAVDKSGERLSLAGMDITDFVEQKAPLDFEHAAEHQAKKGEGEGQWIEEKGARPGASDIIGRVLYGKKVFRREDAENDRQRAYWDRIGLPYLYFIAELYDEDGHAGAQEVAAIVRNGKRTGRGIVLGVSVGGATLDRDGPDGKGNTLTATVARSLACTLRPCNASCQIDILGDQSAVMKTDRLVGWTTLEGIDPEVDEELIKSIPSALVQDAALAKKAPADIGAEAPAAPAAAPKAKAPLPRLTVRGQGVRATPAQAVRLDEGTGTLHTPRGSFRLYAPNDEGYQKILNDPETDRAHGRAMEGWTRAHEAYRAGQVPHEVVMHGTLFSMMSPSTPVPLQELMYSQLVDSMRHTGHDARRPGFESTLEHWKGKSRANELPTHSRAHFEGNQGVHVQATGAVRPHDKPDQKAEAIGRYHQMHDQLADLVRRHGRDAQGAASELIAHKVAEASHAASRKRTVEAGRPDPGPYPSIKPFGLATKTSRYALGMMGGGNVTVPDTHFIRHTFGLDLNRDADAIEYLKQTLWSPQNHHAMNGLDRWYVANHPAVRHMLSHPVWGKHFRQPEDAIFPAFWKHWMTINPHERQQGLAVKGHNELTTHAPFWDAVDPYTPVAKSEAAPDGAADLPLHTARAHQAWAARYGEVPASMLYATFLLPRLLAAAQRRTIPAGLPLGKAEAPGNGTDAVVPRLESLTVALGAALPPPAAAPDALWPGGPSIHDVRMIDPASQSAIRSGRFMLLGGALHHLEDHHGLLARVLPEGPVTPVTHQIIDGLRASPFLTVSPDHDFLAGHPGLHPTLGRLPEAPLDGAEPAPEETPAPPEGIDGVEAYHYHRAGADPVLLEVSGDDAYLDGRPVPPSLLRLMMQNVRLGVAQLAPAPRPEEGLAKDEGGIGGIMSPATALDHIRRAAAYGHLHPDVADAMTHHIYTDKLAAEGGAKVGNAYAWSEFQKKQRPGVYAFFDGQDFGSINKQYSQEHGNEAIKGYFKAARDAADEAHGRGPGAGKLFRNPDQEDLYRAGGDEGIAWFPSYEHAVGFLDKFRQHLDAHPPIGGTHRLSAAVGLGHTPEHANAAMNLAKQGKYTTGGARKYPVGQMPNLGHSLVPGKEGALKLHSEAPPPVPPAPKP